MKPRPGSRGQGQCSESSEWVLDGALQGGAGGGRKGQPGDLCVAGQHPGFSGAFSTLLFPGPMSPLLVVRESGRPPVTVHCQLDQGTAPVILSNMRPGIALKVLLPTRVLGLLFQYCVNMVHIYGQ